MPKKKVDKYPTNPDTETVTRKKSKIKPDKSIVLPEKKTRLARPIIAIILLIALVVAISVVVYIYVENMGDYVEGYVLSNEPAGLNYMDDGTSREYYTLIIGQSPNATQKVSEQVIMSMVYETHDLDPPEIGDHIRIFYDTESPVFVTYRIKYL